VAPAFGTTGLFDGSLLRKVWNGAEQGEDEAEDRRGAEGQDRAGGAAQAGDGERLGAALSGSSEPGLRVEEAALDNAARAFDPKIGLYAEAETAREIEKLHGKIGQLTIENDFFANGFGR
jgi:hypothetical protein